MSRRSDRPGADDPVRLRSEALCRFFERVMTRQVRRHFRAVRLARPGVPDLPADRPLMVYTNHPSWWDPAVFIATTTALFPGRQSYGAMDAEALERYRFMRRIGLFGVRRDPRRGASDFLRPALHLVSRPDRVLWVTAQGEFTDPRTRPVRLRGGAAHLLARAPGLIALPLAVEYPFWSEKRPEALILAGDPVSADGATEAADLEPRLAGALETAMDRLAALACGRSAEPFLRLLDGTEGVGGAYAGWSRLRAALSGRRYVPQHMEET